VTRKEETGPGLLRIARLAASGEGVAETGERVAFALPGEMIRPGEAGLPEPVLASPDRVPPACRHFGLCGGCRMQHASDGFLLGWKESLVERALAARGLRAPFRPSHVSPPASRRRVVLAGRRTRRGAIVGFRAHRSHEIVAIGECPVSRPEIVAALPAFAALVEAGGTRSGILRLSVTLSEAGLDVAASGGRPASPGLLAALAGLAAAHDLARLAWEGEVVALRRPPEQRIGRARPVPPPGGFLQATGEGAAAMTAAVREIVGAARRVVDLHAGIGTFALVLAERAEVHAVEVDPGALAALEAGWRGATGLRRVTTELRDLDRRPLLGPELARFEAAVIDPPRAGAEAQARRLAEAGPARIAAVSCNPVAFARDAAILVAGGYRLDWVRVIDQFRWSSHVEIVASLTRG
jgi:23S rRNA (uracil1939-C5)-methyltransferase